MAPCDTSAMGGGSTAHDYTPATVPSNVASSNKEAEMEELKSKLSMGKLRGMIPNECFEKSLPTSLFYMARDFAFLAAGWYVYAPYVQGNWALTLLWWNYMGFFMWALFVVGHDCGHTTFSNYPYVNAICGHICHAFICVPFWPWAKSHHQHHMFHNHIEKDMSFRWFTREEFAESWTPVKYLLQSPIHPFVSFSVSYLFFGYYDGSHYNPFSDALFWNRREKVQAAVSIAAVAAFLYILVDRWFAYDFYAIVMQYTIPWAIYNYWLVMVTYMQHHEPDTVTYDDSDYNFAVAAMQTVDRTYGWGLDGMIHNITDGHVAHHLFFTKIPHYNLAKATRALSPYLSEVGVYRKHYNPNFLWDFIKYNYQYGLYTHSRDGSHDNDGGGMKKEGVSKKQQ